MSVSRNHAVLKYNKENGDLTIENRSKTFGTLVLIKGNIKIKENKIFFQVGKSLVTARLVEKRENNDEYFTYDVNDNNESTCSHSNIKEQN